MNVTINGQAKHLDNGTIIDMLRAHGLENRMVVVEIDGAIIPKEAWEQTELRDGMRIEIVHFVGGG